MNETKKTGLIAAGIVASLVVVSGIVAGVVSTRGRPSTGGGIDGGGVARSGIPSLFGPRESASEEWTHKDFESHLAGKGLRLETGTSQKFRGDGPAMWFIKARPQPGTRFFHLNEGYVTFPWEDAVVVVKMPTAEKAKDEAGVLGDNAWAWGRFFIAGDPALVLAIRKTF